MKKPGKVISISAYRKVKSYDNALPLLEAYLHDTELTKAVQNSRKALANLIINSCKLAPGLQKRLGVSDQELQQIADGPVPKPLVAKFVEYLKESREYFASRINE